MNVEVFEHAVKVGTWRTVVFHLSCTTFRMLVDQVHQDRLLSQIVFFLFLGERVIVVAISINVVRIYLIKIFLCLDLEESASC